MKIREMLSVYINYFVRFFGKTESPINHRVEKMARS